MDFFAALLLSVIASEGPAPSDCGELVGPKPAGCALESCAETNYDAVDMPIDFEGNETPIMRHFEGRRQIATWQCERQRGQPAEEALVRAFARRGQAIRYSGTPVGMNSVVTARKGRWWLHASLEPIDGTSDRWTVTAVRTMDLVESFEAHPKNLAEALERNGRVTLHGVQFEEGSSSIDPDSKEVLATVALVMRDHPTWRVRVEAHTDDKHPRAYSRKITELQAREVSRWLTGAGGVDRTRVFWKGAGESKPIAENRSLEGRARNRRIELVLF